MGILFALVGALVVGVAYAVRSRRRTRRQRALVRLCLDAGLEFAVSDPFPDTLFLPFRLFGRGGARGVDIVVWDRRDDGAIRAFDYWFEDVTDAGRVRVSMTCGVVPLPFAVPPLSVSPRGTVDPSGESTSGVEVSFELETFNRRFAVTAVEPLAAVAFLDQRMMSTLLSLPIDVAIHVREDRMLLVARWLQPEEMLVLLEVARGLARRVPPVMASLYPPRPPEGPFEDRWMQGSWSPDPTSAERTGTGRAENEDRC